jgi:hypothetical protein
VPLRVAEQVGDGGEASRYIGALASAEAIDPMADSDFDGCSLSGANRYAIMFAWGGEPPVYAFGSLTMYDARDDMRLD